MLSDRRPSLGAALAARPARQPKNLSSAYLPATHSQEEGFFDSGPPQTVCPALRMAR